MFRSFCGGEGGGAAPQIKDKLSLDDLHGVLSKYGISREDVASVVAAMDRDGDGFLSLEEFSGWMTHNTDSLQEAVRRRWHATEASPGKPPGLRGIADAEEEEG